MPLLWSPAPVEGELVHVKDIFLSPTLCKEEPSGVIWVDRGRVSIKETDRKPLLVLIFPGLAGDRNDYYIDTLVRELEGTDFNRQVDWSLLNFRGYNPRTIDSPQTWDGGHGSHHDFF